MILAGVSKVAHRFGLVVACCAALAACNQGNPVQSAHGVPAAQDDAAAAPAVAAIEARVKEARLADTKQALVEHRALQLARLHAYAIGGAFPRNPARNPAPLHMFKDPEGRRCAVANLIHEDGQGELVDRMAREHNDVVVADQESGPLHEWVLTSGLTNEEVRKIQGIGFEGFGLGPVAESGFTRERILMQSRLLTIEQELATATDDSIEIALARLEDSRIASL